MKAVAREIRLPFPPSVNMYYRKDRGHIHISDEGGDYRSAVWAQLVACGVAKNPMTGRIKLLVAAFPPDRRRRDLDNTLKALLDSLQHGEMFLDDSQIDDLHIVRREVDPEGAGYVMVYAEEC